MFHCHLKYLLSVIIILIFSYLNLPARENRIDVENFESGKVGEFPKYWKSGSIFRFFSSKAKNIYKIEMDDSGNKFLRAKANNIAETIGKVKKVNIVKYPFVNWSWRVHDLPPGGNEGVKARCDQAASVYVVIGDSIRNHRSIKYTWSTTLPIGHHTRSPYDIFSSRTDIIVVESGPQKKRRWIRFKRNVLKDYKKLYNVKKVDKLWIKGIAILTDSDNTKSLASADYDNIFFTAK